MKYKKRYLTVFVAIVLSCFSFLMIYSRILAGPQSSTYELQQYQFGSGGQQGATSTTYSLFGTAGETGEKGNDSATYQLNAGLIHTLIANTPPAPTVSNPGSNYDRLQIIVATGNNPTDVTYAIAIKKTSDTWAQALYVQNDYSVGATLGAEDWLLYSGGALTGWGGASGFYATGLDANTLYDVRVVATNGTYGESPWGPSASASTSVPSLTFVVSKTSVQFNALRPANSYTDSKNMTITTSTNAYNGYIVLAHATGLLTFGPHTIPMYSSSNSSPTTWSGLGFGYTTTDSDLTGGTADRFTNGGPKYAGFTTSIPGDPVADHAGPILTPISSEQFTVTFQVAANSTTTAGQYQTVITYIVVPTY
jgi:hypothetical protein